LIVLLTGTLLISTVYTARQVAESASKELIGGAVASVRSELHRFTDPVQRSLFFGVQLARSGVLDIDDTAGMNAILMPLVTQIPQISAVSVGDAEGRGYLLLRLPGGWRNRLVWADRWGDRIEFSEWNDEAELLREWTVEDPSEGERYDPRTRDWYQMAFKAAPKVSSPHDVIWTDIYRFFATGKPGVTAMLPVRDAKGRSYVMAYDLTLSDLTEFTQNLEVSPNGFAFLLDENERILGVSGLAQEEVMAGFKALRSGKTEVFSFHSEGERWWATVQPYPLGANRELTIAALVPEHDLVGVIAEQRTLLLGVSLLGFGFATAMAFWLARRYARPLATLAHNSQQIGVLELAKPEPVKSGLREIDQLAVEQERMRLALDSFSRYVPTEIIRELLARGEAARIGGARCEITSLFTDIAGFTTISEKMSPEALTAHVAEYYEEMLGILQVDGFGTVTQLSGDGVVAMWGAPVDVQDHARRAVEAVICCSERLEALNADWSARGMEPLPTRFGLASGVAVVGNVGSASRLVYTAMGDTVNLASRLEGLGRSYGTSVLAGASTREAAGPGFAWRTLDVVRVRGKASPVEVSALLGRKSEVAASVCRFAERYEEALAFYRSRKFERAVELLQAMMREEGVEGSTERLLTLARGYMAHPPPDGWDGVSNFFEK